MDWEGLATAYLDRERSRLGLPSREELAMKRAEEARTAAAAASQLESAEVGRDLTRAKLAALPAEQDLERRLREAQIRNYDEPPRPVAPRAPHYVTDAKGNVRAITMTDSGFDIKDLGGIGQPQRDTSRGADDGSAFWAPAMVDGKLVYVDKRTRQVVEGITPPPTAEMRNTEYQAQALEPAFESMKESLGVLKGATSGFTGTAAAAVPGTDAYWAKDAFISKAKALAGAITARMAGEGSRLSDEDRVAYSRASAIVDNMILLPGGVQEAERRLTEVQALLSDIQARRNRSAAGFDVSGAATPPQSGATTTVRNASEYAALPSGTIYFDPSGKRRRKP